MRTHPQTAGRRGSGPHRASRLVDPHLGGWTHDRRHHPAPARRRPAGGGRGCRRSGRRLRGVRGLGRRGRSPALPGAGRGGHRTRVGCQRRPVDPHRHRQVARRRRGALRRPRRGQAELLHGADQGPRLREVLPARRPVRCPERRHGDGRLERQRGRPDRVLHGGDPREPRAAAGPGRRRRRGRDGRVPLLRRPRPRVGLAGAAARARARAVPAHVRDARRRHDDRRRPLAPDRPPHRAGHRRLAAGPADVRVRDDARAGDRRTAAGGGQGADLHRALRPGGRARTGAGAHVGARRVTRTPRCRSRRRSRASGSARGSGRPCPPHPCGHRRPPRRHAAEVPTTRRAARPARAPAGHLRHRHPRRRHQRADPLGAAHRADEVRRHEDAPAVRPRVPPDRRTCRAGRLRHRGRRRRRGAGARHRERPRRRQGR